MGRGAMREGKRGREEDEELYPIMPIKGEKKKENRFFFAISCFSDCLQKRNFSSLPKYES